MDKTIHDYLARIGSKGGTKASAKMTREQRIARAKKARAAQLKEKGAKRQ